MDREKKALRREMRARMATLTEAEIREASRRMTETLLLSPVYHLAGRVFLYLSTNREPATDGILRDALAQGKQVYVPKCTGPHEMLAVRYREGDALKESAYGIREPAGAEETAGPGTPDLILVPCLAAGRDGGRLGHGGGYYDAFLKAATGRKICLCFSALLTEGLPMEAHDVRMDAVLTEQGMFACGED